MEIVWPIFWLCLGVIGLVWGLRWAWRNERGLTDQIKHMFSEVDRILGSKK